MLNGKNLKKHELDNGDVLLEFDDDSSVEFLVEQLQAFQKGNEAESLLSDLERNFSDQNGSFNYPANTTKISRDDFEVLLKLLRDDTDHKKNVIAADELAKSGNRLVDLDLWYHYANFHF